MKIEIINVLEGENEILDIEIHNEEIELYIKGKLNIVISNDEFFKIVKEVHKCVQCRNPHHDGLCTCKKD